MKDIRQLVAEVKTLLKKQQPSSYDVILKWNPNQPRHPKGTGRESGRWSGGGGTGSVQAPPMRMPVVSDAVPFGGVIGTGAIEAGRPDSKLRVMKEGTPKSSDRNGEGGVNISGWIEFEDGTVALYKPETGERWTGGFANDDIPRFIKNRKFSLAEREAFAFEAGEALFGPTNNPVPETVHRKELDLAGLKGGPPDDAAIKAAYEEYKKNAVKDAERYAGNEMAVRFENAQEHHANQAQFRAEQVKEIWERLKKEHLSQGPYGAADVLRAHPVLPIGSPARRKKPTGEKKVRTIPVGGAPEPDEKPRAPRKREAPLGTQPPFERKAKPPVNAMDVLKEADIDLNVHMDGAEKAKVEAILRKRLQEGHLELYVNVNRQAAKDSLDRKQWMKDHESDRQDILARRVQTFDSWKLSQYGASSGGSADLNKVHNKEAPHPKGGSLQRKIDIADSGMTTEEDGVRMAVLDYVLGTMDRHHNNIKWHNDRPVAIDNGYSMPAPTPGKMPDGFQFRSVAVRSWMGGGNRVVPKEHREAILASLNDGARWNALLDRHPDMNKAEREAFLGRLKRMGDAMAYDGGLYNLWKSMNLY